MPWLWKATKPTDNKNILFVLSECILYRDRRQYYGSLFWGLGITSLITIRGASIMESSVAPDFLPTLLHNMGARGGAVD